MHKHGEIVAILNKRQVVVKMANPSVFTVGRAFVVYEIRTLPDNIAATSGITSVELPKGRLKCEALQTNNETALLTTWTETRTVKRNPASALGLSPVFSEPIEVVERVGDSARLNPDQSLAIDVGPVVVGDFVSGD